MGLTDRAEFGVEGVQPFPNRIAFDDRREELIRHGDKRFPCGCDVLEMEEDRFVATGPANRIPHVKSRCEFEECKRRQSWRDNSLIMASC